MSSSKTLRIALVVLGFMAIIGISIGYWLGASGAQSVYDNMHFLLESDRNIETIQNIKALNGLREKQIEPTVEFMQVRVKGALKLEGIKPATIAQALEYQSKYCKTPCLGLE
jgi:hypothetical protein